MLKVYKWTCPPIPYPTYKTMITQKKQLGKTKIEIIKDIFFNQYYF